VFEAVKREARTLDFPQRYLLA